MEQPKKKPYDFVSPELIEKAEGIINHNAKYCNLKKEYEKALSQRNYIKQMQLKAAMDKVMQDVVTKLVETEIEERSNTEELLKMLPYEEGLKYREILNVLCFCYDAIDYALTDVNKLLERNDTGFHVDNIPEVKKCRDKVASVLDAELRKMDIKEQDIYSVEADNIYAYLLKRSGVFRRKVDKLATKDKKGSQNE